MEIAIFLSRAFAAMDAAGHGKVIARPEGGPSADRQGDVPKKLLAFFASFSITRFHVIGIALTRSASYATVFGVPASRWRL
jgi:hypothetical protein